MNALKGASGFADKLREARQRRGLSLRQIPNATKISMITLEASPLLEFFQRGEVARDVRLLAAQGGFAPRADEQLSILVHLLNDPDPEVRQTADDTLNNIPVQALQGFLARPDISLDLREFFADRGIFPDEDVVIAFDKALIDT